MTMNDQTETLTETVKEGVEVAANTALAASSQPVVTGGNVFMTGLKYVGTAMVGATIGILTYFGVKKAKAHHAKKAAEKDAKKVEGNTAPNPKQAQANAKAN